MAMGNSTRAIAALCLSLLFFLSHVSGGYGGGACKPPARKKPPVLPPKPPVLPPKKPPVMPPVPKQPPKVFPPKLPPPNPFCPRDTLKLGACAKLLGVASVVIGAPPGEDECCEVLAGLASAEVAACLCTVLKESVLGVVVEWSVAVSTLVSSCRTEIPDGYKCV